MIKGRYVATVTLDFCIDEKAEGLLPFDKLKKQVHEETTAYIENLLADEFENLGSVRVVQQYADLYQAEDE